MGSKYYILCSRPQKGTFFCAARRVLAYFASKSIQGPRLYRVARTQKNNQKTKTFNVQSHACAETKPRSGIMTNFCIGVGVHDVITSANFYDYRLRRLGVAGGGGILNYPLTSECVMINLTRSSQI